MWGIIPAAGRGSRIQPLAFSKELLPVGSRKEGLSEKPVAVSEHLVGRMLSAGVDKICFVIAPGKSDILEYYGGRVESADGGAADICYAVQKEPRGLCDALFRALPFVAPGEVACVGLPDTIWFPHDGFSALDERGLSFLLFPVNEPQRFDAVEIDARGAVTHIDVKADAPRSHWVWGAFKITGRVLADLHALWLEPGRRDEYLGTLVNAYLAQGGLATGVPAGETYVDVGTLSGYREAVQLLDLRLLHGGDGLHDGNGLDGGDGAARGTWKDARFDALANAPRGVAR
jgi:glucose-1-phosphate thymidylyltransferase